MRLFRYGENILRSNINRFLRVLPQDRLSVLARGLQFSDNRAGIYKTPSRARAPQGWILRHPQKSAAPRAINNIFALSLTVTRLARKFNHHCVAEVAIQPLIESHRPILSGGGTFEARLERRL
jgi:hypothetical protein